jgi:GNAT superfamily N-acetyltransferase
MLDIRNMTEADIPLGVQLKDQAGWNQTVADWRRFLAMQPDGCFVAECDGRPVATTVACILGSVGWIAMVLVDKSYRGQGIATRLMEHALAFLDAQAVRSVRLDATPLGEPVYRRLGFMREYELQRWDGVAGFDAPSPPAEPLTPDRFDDVCRLDLEATGADRRRFLDSLWHDLPDGARIALGPDGVDGYALCREGSRAVLIGPVAARSAEAGRSLLESMSGTFAGRRVFVDIPTDNREAVGWAVARGLVVQRPLVRMVRGVPVAERADWLWASSGPELG